MDFKFISYAQNYEDVVLWRALSNIEKGFYVDVGAADPEELSVTRAFYDRGWSGINVEPLDDYFERLEKDRPRDLNLRIAIGREAGVRTLHTIRGSGLSTFDSEVSARHKAAGWETGKRLVPVLTLAKMLEDCASSTIHFLKIDVEGAEREVLEGANFTKIRPWIILVEATEPLSAASTREAWENLITSQGYQFAYFDGLNGFYVADEVSHLKERLAVPPNFFDEFIRRSELLLRNKARELEGEVSSLRNRSHELDQLISERNHVISQKNEEIASLKSRLEKEKEERTQLQRRNQELDKPIAILALERLRKAGDRFTGGGIRALTRNTLRTTISCVMHQRQLMAAARTILKPFPKLTTSLFNAATKTIALPSPSRPSNESEILADMPASARRTYRALRTLMDQADAAKDP